MLVCQCFVWFVIYSVLGWVYESAYCTINERKWENRGFLYGPCCPIYGTGVVGIMLIWYVLSRSGIELTWWQVFLISFFGSAILEYSTHWTLEQLFHAYWWDYSNMPLNLNGRICLPASIAFGLSGVFVIYVLYGPTSEISTQVNGEVFEFLALILMALVAADTAITVSALNRIARAASAINRRVNEHMDQLVATAVEKGEAAAQQIQERRDDAAHVLVEAKQTVLAARDTVSEQVVKATSPDDHYATERERYEGELVDRLLGGMNHYVRAAARRVQGFSPLERMAGVPGASQFAHLMREVRAKHWPLDKKDDDEGRKAA